MECNVSQACTAQTDTEPMLSQTVTNVLWRANGMVHVPSRGTDLLLLLDFQSYPIFRELSCIGPFPLRQCQLLPKMLF